MKVQLMIKKALILTLISQTGWFLNCSSNGHASEEMSAGIVKYAKTQGRRFCKEPNELDDIDYDSLKSKKSRRTHAKNEERSRCIPAPMKMQNTSASRTNKYAVGNPKLAEIRWENPYDLANDCAVCNTSDSY